MSSNSSTTRVFLCLIVVGIFGIITFALAAATLGTVNKRFNRVEDKLSEDEFIVATESELARSVRIEDLMEHLEQFQKFAQAANNNRAMGTKGFNDTVSYIKEYLNKNTNLRVWKESFPVRNFSVEGTPEFRWRPRNGADWVSLNYSTSIAQSDFAPANYTTEAQINRILEIFVVNNSGCFQSDWRGASGKAALVIAGGVCTYAEKGELAQNANAAALIYFNNGQTTSSLAPVIIRLRQRNTLPAVVLSYRIGSQLLQAALQSGNQVNIQMQIRLHNYGTFLVENVFAETTEGNPDQIISVGSHSDSVPEGPGINDNGSGSACNLVLAANLARLYSRSVVKPYPYRIRFSWWGAEEFGLIGSIDHVLNASAQNQLSKYLVNLNFDMMASPNYMFGVYDANLRNPETPQQAIPGSLKITKVFQDWFKDRKLPYTNTEFSGRSDYGPFLQKGIVAGGLFSGADGSKSIEEFQEYRNRLGKKVNALMNAIHDPCYHRLCDNTDNIDRFAFLTMTQAAADILDFLARQGNLKQYLYG